MTDEKQADDPSEEHRDEEAEADEQRRREVPAWLEITGGILAILAFLGITDFHQVTTFLGWTHASPSASASPSPSPSLPPIPADTGPRDPEDVGTCTSIMSDIHEMQSSVPDSYAAKSQFYGDESSSFSGFVDAAVNVNLKLDVLALQVVTAKLDADYKAETLNEPADEDSTSDLAELTSDESKAEAFCEQNCGVTS